MIQETYTLPISSAEIKSSSFVALFPPEIVKIIFATFNLSTLRNCCLVNKKWHQFANDSHLWKKIIYTEFAFGTKKWIQCLGEDALRDENFDEEFASLPLEIVEEYRRLQKAFPKAKIIQDALLIRYPKTLSGELNIHNLLTLSGQLFPKVDWITSSGLSEALELQSINNSRWVICTPIIPESCNQDYQTQIALIKDLSKEHLKGYIPVKALDASICFLARYFLSKTIPSFSTRVEEEEQTYQFIVGIDSEGLFFNYHQDSTQESLGIMAVKNLEISKD